MKRTMQRTVAVCAMVLVVGNAHAGAQTVQICERPAVIPVEVWDKLSEANQRSACADIVAQSAPTMPVQLQPPPPPRTADEEKARAERRKWSQPQGPQVQKRVSPLLGWAGVGTILGGLLVMTPMGEEYHILGDTYCVSTDARSVWEGGCGPDKDAVKFGATMIGIGAVLALIGFHSRTVTVGASVGHDAIGGQATIRWGGTR